MRAVAAAVAVALIVVALPVDAHPFPKTEQAVRTFVRDTLAETDADGAKLIRYAQKILRDAKGQVGTIPMPTIPESSPIEVRASLLQPGLQGRDELLSAVWVGASSESWTGAYWVESTAGASLPSLMTVNEEGILFMLDGGARATQNFIDITYHFLGMDGQHTKHAVGRAVLLAETPVIDRIDAGGIDASTRGKDPEALLVTPWNLFGTPQVMGMTLFAGDKTVQDVTVVSCKDYETPIVPAGCRVLYVLHFPPEATHLRFWHEEPDGSRSWDKELLRGDLEAGYTYG